ncbi:MAG: hypothetical protein JSS09_03015 [Verrucomicrobia bacterium]|nr:hypothetical protein [Verrucomicrobiota bacterium]
MNKEKFNIAAFKAGVNEELANNLWAELHKQKTTKKFDLAHVFYYMGTLFFVMALGWFFNLGWGKLEGKGTLAISLAYIAIFSITGAYLWNKTRFKVPGGLFITLAVCTIPLIIYGIQLCMGWGLLEGSKEYNSFISFTGGKFFMELGTIIGSLVALRYFKFPFLTVPLFVTFWLMSININSLIFGSEFYSDKFLWGELFSSLSILIISYFIDRKTKEDFAFWGYLLGTLLFWGILSLEFGIYNKFSYFLINSTLILLSLLLQRTLFLVFGALGLFVYTMSLFHDHFFHSTFFPIILSSIGIVIVFLGIIYSKNHKKVETILITCLPKSIAKWIPKSRQKLE